MIPCTPHATCLPHVHLTRTRVLCVSLRTGLPYWLSYCSVQSLTDPQHSHAVRDCTATSNARVLMRILRRTRVLRRLRRAPPPERRCSPCPQTEMPMLAKAFFSKVAETGFVRQSATMSFVAM